MLNISIDFPVHSLDSFKAITNVPEACVVMDAMPCWADTDVDVPRDSLRITTTINAWVSDGLSASSSVQPFGKLVERSNLSA